MSQSKIRLGASRVLWKSSKSNLKPDSDTSVHYWLQAAQRACYGNFIFITVATLCEF